MRHYDQTVLDQLIQLSRDRENTYGLEVTHGSIESSYNAMLGSLAANNNDQNRDFWMDLMYTEHAALVAEGKPWPDEVPSFEQMLVTYPDEP